MLSSQGNPVKNKIYLAVLAVIIIVAAAVLLNNYIFSGEEEAAVTAAGTGGGAAQIEKKELDLSLFQDPRFVGLNDYSVKPVDLGRIEVGKDNPFAGAQVELND